MWGCTPWVPEAENRFGSSIWDCDTIASLGWHGKEVFSFFWRAWWFGINSTPPCPGVRRILSLMRWTFCNWASWFLYCASMIIPSSVLFLTLIVAVMLVRRRRKSNSNGTSKADFSLTMVFHHALCILPKCRNFGIWRSRSNLNLYHIIHIEECSNIALRHWHWHGHGHWHWHWHCAHSAAI